MIIIIEFKFNLFINFYSVPTIQQNSLLNNFFGFSQHLSVDLNV